MSAIGRVVVTIVLVAMLIGAGAALYSVSALREPDSATTRLQRTAELRQVTDPAALLKELFPPDSRVYQDAESTPDNIPYEDDIASDQMIFAEMNKFIAVSLDASFESEEKFGDWLYGQSQIVLKWSKSVAAKGFENEINHLWRPLLLDYAKRLSFRARSLAAARKQHQYASSFDRLTAPTGPSQAPYFLMWFFEKLEAKLGIVDRELSVRR